MVTAGGRNAPAACSVCMRGTRPAAPCSVLRGVVDFPGACRAARRVLVDERDGHGNINQVPLFIARIHECMFNDYAMGCGRSYHVMQLV